jgi:hypothetical protein
MVLKTLTGPAIATACLTAVSIMPVRAQVVTAPDNIKTQFVTPGPQTNPSAPPAHRHARVSTHHHGLKAHPPSAMSGTAANQLNQEELSRLQSGNFSNPPAPSGLPVGPETSIQGGQWESPCPPACKPTPER